MIKVLLELTVILLCLFWILRHVAWSLLLCWFDGDLTMLLTFHHFFWGLGLFEYLIQQRVWGHWFGCSLQPGTLLNSPWKSECMGPHDGGVVRAKQPVFQSAELWNATWPHAKASHSDDLSQFHHGPAWLPPYCTGTCCLVSRSSFIIFHLTCSNASECQNYCCFECAILYSKAEEHANPESLWSGLRSNKSDHEPWWWVIGDWFRIMIVIVLLSVGALGLRKQCSAYLNFPDVLLME